MARENALKAHTATLGTLVAWGVLSGLLCGGFAYLLTGYWWWGRAVLGGTAGTRGGSGCLNRFSASISGVSAGVRLPSGLAVR